MKVGLLYSRIRQDEKLLLAELRDRDHEVVKVDARDQRFGLDDPPEALADVDVVLDRCLSKSQSLHVSQFCGAYGIPIVNEPDVMEQCSNKVKNSLALSAAGVPTPRTEVSFTIESALESIEDFGYPCVIKPVVGSWGRLIAKIDTRDAAEAILEHKSTLGHYEHKIFYIQEYVDKPDRDIRALTLDGEPVAAMVRSSEHWLTNAAKGASVEEFELDPEAERLVREASAAVGGGLLGVDLMETADGYTVHEVNTGVEFKALNSCVDADVPGRVIDWLEAKARAGAEATP